MSTPSAASNRDIPAANSTGSTRIAYHGRENAAQHAAEQSSQQPQVAEVVVEFGLVELAG